MPTTITILTPENVEITYELAGLAIRILAALVDSVIQGAAILLLVLALVGIRTGIGPSLENWLIAAGILLFFVIILGYFLFFEARWNGQTPGKRLTGLRVMKDAGFPLDFRSAAVRNIVRLADLLPGSYAIGMTAVFFSHEYKRLGDYAAGTVVIRERPRSAPLFVESRELRVESPTTAVSASTLNSQPSTLNSPRLPRVDELHAIRHFLDRRAGLTPEARAAYARRLALAFGRLLGYPLDQVAAAPEAFLQWLTDEAARRQGAG